MGNRNTGRTSHDASQTSIIKCSGPASAQVSQQSVSTDLALPVQHSTLVAFSCLPQSELGLTEARSSAVNERVVEHRLFFHGNPFKKDSCKQKNNSPHHLLLSKTWSFLRIFLNVGMTLSSSFSSSDVNFCCQWSVRITIFWRFLEVPQCVVLEYYDEWNSHQVGFLERLVDGD